MSIFLSNNTSSARAKCSASVGAGDGLLGRCGGETDENDWIRAKTRSAKIFREKALGNLWKCNQVCLFVLKRSLIHAMQLNTPTPSAKQVVRMHTNARNAERNHAWRIYMINKCTSLVLHHLVSLTWENRPCISFLTLLNSLSRWLDKESRTALWGKSRPVKISSLWDKIKEAGFL